MIAELCDSCGKVIRRFPPPDVLPLRSVAREGSTVKTGVDTIEVWCWDCQGGQPA